jgi:4'-phosphopantetheinyl transferase EntD
MNNDENQSKPIAEKSQQSNKEPSQEAIEIAARIMANRALRELELKQQKTPSPKSETE